MNQLNLKELEADWSTRYQFWSMPPLEAFAVIQEHTDQIIDTLTEAFGTGAEMDEIADFDKGKFIVEKPQTPGLWYWTKISNFIMFYTTTEEQSSYVRLAFSHLPGPKHEN